MHQAYWNEPLPLRMNYPMERSTGWPQTIIFVIIVAAISCLPEMPKYPGPLWHVACCYIGVITFAAVIAFVPDRINARLALRAWQKAFIANNSDIGIDYDAVKKIVVHMQKTTHYKCVDFKNVAIHLVVTLRKSDVMKGQSAFGYEVVQNYLFYTGKRSNQPDSLLPRV